MTRVPPPQADGAPAAAAAAATATLPVWDRPVRLLHWTLVVAVAGAALTTAWWVGAHQPLGWLAAGVVVARVGLGVLAASRYSRFAQFVRSPRATLAYAVLWWRRREPRYVGHNPLGGWMVLVLMAWVVGLALTGWLYTTDRFWGDAVVEAVHEALAWSLLGLVAAHVAGVVHAGRRHRENLLRAMLDGRKRAPADHDVA